MNDLSVDVNTGEIANYKPKDSLQKMAFAEVAEKHYKRARDLEGLHKAIEVIWTERNEFVTWWDKQEKPDHATRFGNDGSSADATPVKLEDFDLNKFVVSRWRQKIAGDLQAFIKQQCEKADNLIDPKATADKHTGDEESYTPPQFIESARRVMGQIDLDPASNDMAQETVQAGEYFTEEDNGLLQSWYGNVWMNPPYTARVINEFIGKLRMHYDDGDIQQAIVLTNNNTDTSWFHGGMKSASAICLTAGRINFLKRDGSTSSPTNGQLFFYFGDDVESFKNEFSQYGLVMVKA